MTTIVLVRKNNEVVVAGDGQVSICLLYTSDAADEGLGVDLGGRRIIKKSFKKIYWY